VEETGENRFYLTMDSPLGDLTLTASPRGLTGLLFGGHSEGNSCSLLEEARVQLLEYFNGTRRTFTIPTDIHGSAFQTLVWSQMVKIPYGQTLTYGQLAARIGKPCAARAVGNACGANPVAILVPCHRVVGASGTGGYSGSCGVKGKQFLLRLEQNAAGEDTQPSNITL
jgi:methylated-DNA-[protein]-cysteine S-methyltransferase